MHIKKHCLKKVRFHSCWLGITTFGTVRCGERVSINTQIIRYILAFLYTTLFFWANFELSLSFRPAFQLATKQTTQKRCEEQQHFVFFLHIWANARYKPENEIFHTDSTEQSVAATLSADLATYENTRQWNEKNWRYFFVLASSGLRKEGGSVHKVLQLDAKTNCIMVCTLGYVSQQKLKMLKC